MPEPISLITALKTISPYVQKAAGLVWKHLPRNRPIQKAIRTTSETYSTRLPGLDSLLKEWLASDAFKGNVESCQDGKSLDTDLNHVQLFVETTGLGHGMLSLQIVQEGLSAFYREIYLEFWAGGFLGVLAGG